MRSGRSLRKSRRNRTSGAITCQRLALPMDRRRTPPSPSSPSSAPPVYSTATATSCPWRARPAARTASCRWLPPTARSRTRKSTFIYASSLQLWPARRPPRTTFAMRSSGRSTLSGSISSLEQSFGGGASWQCEGAQPGRLARSFDADLLFSPVAAARSRAFAIWHVRHFSGFRALMGRSRQAHGRGLRCQYPGRSRRRTCFARPLCRAGHRLHLGDGGAPVCRDQGGDGRDPSSAQAGLCQPANLVLSLSCRGRRGRRARPILLWTLPHPANSRIPRPGDRYSHLLAFLLLGGGRQC